MSSALLLALSPWLVFVFSARSGGVNFTTAALITLCWSGGLAARSLRQGRRPTFEIWTVFLFGGMALIGFFLPGAWADEMAPYGRSIALLGLALIAFCSLAFQPFTREYTRDLVTSDQLSAAAFGRGNVVLTATWCAAALSLAASFLAGAALHGAVATTTFNWLLPLLIVIICVRYPAGRWLEDFNEEEEGRAGLDAALALSGDGWPEAGPGSPSTRPRLHLLRAPGPGDRSSSGR